MTAPDPARVTLLLQRLASGDRPAGDELFGMVYDELRALARGIAGPARGRTLQPTALVHEAWLKLGDGSAWESRRHFFAVAAKAMRQILASHARDARAQKRGGAWQRVTLQRASAEAADPATDALDLVALDAALEKLGEADEELLRVFELHWLAGLDTGEVAHVLGLGQRSVQLKWRAVRAFLGAQLGAAG